LPNRSLGGFEPSRKPTFQAGGRGSTIPSFTSCWKQFRICRMVRRLRFLSQIFPTIRRTSARRSAAKPASAISRCRPRATMSTSMFGFLSPEALTRHWRGRAFRPSHWRILALEYHTLFTTLQSEIAAVAAVTRSKSELTYPMP
jgi:hypothetical protein